MEETGFRLLSKALSVLLLFRYVLEDSSPYRRKTKQENKQNARHKRTAYEEVEEDLRRAGMLESTDTVVRDSDPDQKLTLKQLLIRYKGELLPKFNKLAYNICQPMWYITI